MSRVADAHALARQRPDQRVVTRAVLDFAVKSAQVGSASVAGEFKRFVVLLAIAEAADWTDISDRTGSMKWASLRAVARSLNQPYETCRRSALALVEAGLCTKNDRGSVAISLVARPQVARLRRKIGKLFLRMALDLAAIGYDFSGGQSEQQIGVDAAEPGTAPNKALPLLKEQMALLQRVACNFFLRCIETGMPPHGRRMDRILIFTAIIAANAEAITYNKALAWQYASASSPPPDEARRPITISAVARATGFPLETTRRSINDLISSGLCERVGREGVIVPTHVNQRPDILSTGTLVTVRFIQAISELKRQRIDFARLQAAAERRNG